MNRVVFVVAVTGSRYYSDKQRVFDTLDELYNKVTALKWGGLRVVEGGYLPGADYFARQWVRRRSIDGWNVSGATVHAEWRKYGKAAGPIRNGWIIKRYRPMLVVAFPGHKGTRDMVHKAHEAQIPVFKTSDWSVYGDDDYRDMDEVLKQANVELLL